MKNILFVDDERELLDGLRARLYKNRQDWNMQFVLSGDEAIATDWVTEEVMRSIAELSGQRQTDIFADRFKRAIGLAAGS